MTRTRFLSISHCVSGGPKTSDIQKTLLSVFLIFTDTEKKKEIKGRLPLNPSTVSQN